MATSTAKASGQRLTPLVADHNTIMQQAMILVSITKTIYAIFALVYAGSLAAQSLKSQSLTSHKNNAPERKSTTVSPADTKPTATEVWVFNVAGKKGMVLNDALAEECRKYDFQVVRRFKVGTYKKGLQARKAQYGAFDEDIQASYNIVGQVRAERALRRGA